MQMPFSSRCETVGTCGSTPLHPRRVKTTSLELNFAPDQTPDTITDPAFLSVNQ
jgi:hypothetical protein